MSSNIPPFNELSQCLLDINQSISKRTHAAFYLRSFYPNDCINILISTLINRNDSSLMRHEIAYVLGQLRNKEPIPVLTDILSTESEDLLVRHECAEALGAIGDESSIDILTKYSTHPTNEISETCLIAIDLINWRKKNESVNTSVYKSIDPAPSLQIDNSLSINELRQKLMDRSLSLFDRYRAMFTLRDLNSNDSALALLDGFNDESALFRHEVAYVLGQMQRQVTINGLSKVLNDISEHRMVRHEAAEALGAIGGHEVEETKEIASKKRVLGFVSDPNELEDEIIKPIVKRNKQIDNFLLEIKSKHGNNDDQDIDDHLLESNDNTSTNLYIGHLAPTVTEEELFKLFSKYGDINGIKILWPRSEDEKLRKRNCGFVSYMKRIDAQNAMMHLHEYEIHDQAITVGWGKPVKLNTTPMTLQSLTNPLINANVQPYAVPSINPITNQLVTTNKWDITPNDNIIEVDYKPGDPSIQIRVPENDDVVYLIDTLAKVVAVDGDQIEKIIKQREESNPNFTFLRISDSLEGWYYRWRTYSYIMGDSDRTWRTKPFQLMPGGTFIIPPPNN
eukprot:gene21171-27429_t